MVTPEPNRPPPIDERYRMFLRILVVVAAYGAYLVVQRENLVPGILVGAGAIALGFSVVDRLTLWRRDRSEMVLVGATFLGLGLLAIGLFLYFT
jgi:fructose-specific phosphotransferase system IIC component